MVNDPPYFSYLSQILDKILLYFRLDKRVINFKIPQRLSYSVRKKGNKFWVRMWNIFSCSVVVILSFFVGGKKEERLKRSWEIWVFRGGPVYTLYVLREAAIRGVERCHLSGAFSPTLSAKPFWPTFGATPKIRYVPSLVLMMDLWMILNNNYLYCR